MSLSLKRQLCEFSEGVCRNVHIHTVLSGESPEPSSTYQMLMLALGAGVGIRSQIKKIGLVPVWFFCRSFP